MPKSDCLRGDRWLAGCLAEENICMFSGGTNAGESSFKPVLSVPCRHVVTVTRYRCVGECEIFPFVCMRFRVRRYRFRYSAGVVLTSVKAAFTL